MNYEALRAALAKLGIELPVDPTVPRVTPEALTAWKAQLAAKYDELRPTADLATLRDIRAGEAAMKAEVDDRTAKAALDAERAAEIAAEQEAADKAKAAAGVKPEEGKQDPEPGAAAGTEGAANENPEGKPSAAVIGAGVTATEPSKLTEDPTGQLELAKVASVQAPGLKEGTKDAEPPKAPWRTASADPSRIGQELPTISAIGEQVRDTAMLAERMANEGGRFGDSKHKVVLASVAPYTATTSTDGVLMRGHGADKNTQIIESYLADHAAMLEAVGEGKTYVRTAAAPWCEPYDVIRTLPECAEQSTPFRDALPFVPMGHGGFTFNVPVTLEDLSGSVDIWTPEDQALIDPTDPETWKRCLRMECLTDPPVITLDDWLTACLDWQIGMDLNNPERFRQYFTKLETARARLVEQYLMSLVDVLTINYDNDDGTGANYRIFGGLIDLIRLVLAAFQGAEYDERLQPNGGYTMFLDTAQLDTLVAGEIAAASAKTNGTRAGVLAFIREKLPMIDRVIVVHDRVPGSYGTVSANGNPKAALPAINQADAATPALVTAGRIRVIPTSEVFAFGTGELRTGVKQDFSMARQNIVGWFAEEAIALTKYGCRPWFRFDVTLCSISRYAGELMWSVDGVTDPFSCDYVPDNAAADEPDPFPLQT